ncbi:MAG: peptidylprolyl isomerase FKBP-type [Deltaproteobacteria bacterium]|jgi:peptidylprolyl isomerase|nr:peptidylprolyl isomerase FKBP-type [Deltaproteobacteria bacterium]
MAEVKGNDTVKVHYTGRLSDGTVFDSSLSREPLEFTIGQKMVIPGFEEGMIGMTVGETRTVSIASQDAYGPYLEDLVGSIKRTQIPPNIDLQVGGILQMQTPDGGTMLVVVKALTDEAVTLDANHPLAGKDLAFEINLLEIAS